MSFHNDGKSIWTVIARSACNVHGAQVDDPCWVVKPLTDPFLNQIAVCGSRIRAAGFNGVISPLSLRKTAPGPFNGRPNPKR